MRHFPTATRILAVWGTLILGGQSAVRAEPKLPSRPNVLFIAIDDLRDWVGYLRTNLQVKTPHLDRLAARGLAFTHSYCPAPVCNGSRAALMSGLRPSTTGVYENNVDWRRVIPAAVVTLPIHFRQNGYYCAGAGKIYHGGFDRRSDWDDYLSRGTGAKQGEGQAKARRGKDAAMDVEARDFVHDLATGHIDGNLRRHATPAAWAGSVSSRWTAATRTCPTTARCRIASNNSSAGGTSRCFWPAGW